MKSHFNYLPSSDDFVICLKTFATVWIQIRPDTFVGPDLNLICLTLLSLKELLKNVNFVKKISIQKKHAKLPSMQISKFYI